MKKLHIILSLLLTMIFLISCAPNVYDKTTTEPTTTDIATVNFQKENVKISDKFTWDDYLFIAEKYSHPDITLCDYFSTYYFGTEDNQNFLVSEGENGDFKYRLFENKKVFITEYSGDSSTVTIPSVIDGHEVIGVTCRFDKSEFLPNISLKEVTVDDGIQYIGEACFENCMMLEKVSLPQSLLCIDNGAFHGCKALSEIALPQRLNCIDDSAFFECGELKQITIPDSVEYLGSYAFFSCSELKCVKLSANVNQLHGSTFYNCSMLSSFEAQNLKQAFEADFHNTKIDIDSLVENGTEIK